MVLCAIACSWFAVKMQRIERRREAVKAIIGAGGSVKYDYELAAAKTNSPPKPPGPAWLRKMLGDNFFATVIMATVWNKAELGRLKELTNLEWLYLIETQVTDAGLEHLKELTNLETLILLETQVTEEGVKKLQKALPNCNIVTEWP